MTAARAPGVFPKGAGPVVAAALALTVLAAAWARVEGARDPSPATPAVESRSLVFTDRDDGSVLITDARDGRTVLRLAPGEDAFTRGTMRGLNRDRKRRGVEDNPPFLISRLADGRLVLTDPEAEKTIDMGAFGPTNLAAFARLLTAPGGQP